MKLRFVKTRPAHGPSGGLRASSHYIFEVDGKQVAVEVYSSAMRTLDGNLPPDKVKVAAEAFLKIELERHGAENLPGSLVLDEPTMDFVANRLGWTARFGQR